MNSKCVLSQRKCSLLSTDQLSEREQFRKTTHPETPTPTGNTWWTTTSRAQKPTKRSISWKESANKPPTTESSSEPEPPSKKSHKTTAPSNKSIQKRSQISWWVSCTCAGFCLSWFRGLRRASWWMRVKIWGARWDRWYLRSWVSWKT